MRLGLHVGYWGLGLSAREQLELVREAEGWVTTRCGRPRPMLGSAATNIAWLAGRPSGSSSARPSSRCPPAPRR